MGHVFDANTVALWRLDETVSAADSGDYAASPAVVSGTYDLAQATFANRPLIQGGPNPDGTQYSRWFDGNSYFMSNAADASLRSVATASYTIEAWIYWEGFTAGSPFATIFSLAGLSASETEAENALAALRLTGTGELFVFWEYSTGTNAEFTDTVTTLSKRQWHHVAVVVTIGATAAVDFYVDGSFSDGTTGLTVATGGGNATLWIGATNDAGSPTNIFNGAISDIRLSNTAKSSGEIAADAASYQHSVDGSTYEIWRLNEAPEAVALSNMSCAPHMNPANGTSVPDVVSSLIGGDGRARFSNAAAGEYLACPRREDIRAILQGEWTFEGWFQKKDAQALASWFMIGYGAIGETQGANSQISIFTDASNHINVGWESGAGTNIGGTPSTATVWETANGQERHHIAVVKELVGGSTYSTHLYLNGSFVETLDTGLSAPDGGDAENVTFAIGAFGDGTQVFSGRYDDVRLSDVARSAAEILESYRGGIQEQTYFYKMRGQDDGRPAPGFVTWSVQDQPDYDGLKATSSNTSPPLQGSIVAGSTVVLSKTLG